MSERKESTNATCDTAIATITVVASSGADVSVEKTLITQAPFTLGQTVTYEILVINLGPDTAINVKVEDTPNNVTLAAMNPSIGSCDVMTKVCSLSDMLVNDTVTITVEGTLDNLSSFGNSATVNSDTPDGNPSNDTSVSGHSGTMPTLAVPAFGGLGLLLSSLVMLMLGSTRIRNVIP